ncbi:MAG: N-acetylneuraminate synthase [Candidatus Omnitrophica bacterium]|nr:N-acetylneuraminate synthase [Candidatus Omnitrophota bacterium]
MSLKKRIRIGNKVIGEGKPCFIIAEAGVNHNGKIRLAKRLIDAAKTAGADAVKFQTFTAGELVGEDIALAGYQKKNMPRMKNQKEMLATLELTAKDFVMLKKYCDKKKIVFLSTPHTEGALAILEDIVPAYKVASGDITNIPFLIKIAKKKKPVILSTGMATLKEVQTAVGAVTRYTDKLVVLHCTTNYPCPADEVNLRAMDTLKEKGKNLTGYSDHTSGYEISLAAVALGAVIIEKHLTLDRTLPGPDHRGSLTPGEFKAMIKAIRIVERSLGSAKKEPTVHERKIASVVRKSIVAHVAIDKGTQIVPDMVTVRRPATGIAPYEISRVIGKKVKKNIPANTVLTWGMLI